MCGWLVNLWTFARSSVQVCCGGLVLGFVVLWVYESNGTSLRLSYVVECGCCVMRTHVEYQHDKFWQHIARTAGDGGPLRNWHEAVERERQAAEPQRRCCTVHSHVGTTYDHTLDPHTAFNM